MYQWRGLALAVLALVGLAPVAQSAPTNPRAPELQAKQWINSSPLTLAQLRGKVVAVEFWAYG